MKQVTAILLGAGQRGAGVYAEYALQFPNELKIVAVAEPRTDRRDALAKSHHIPAENCVDSWEELLNRPKFADCVFVCTQDRMHYMPVMLSLIKGYDVLCEKPMSYNREELVAMGTMAKNCGRLLSICHVLRYSPFFVKLKELIDSGAIGQLVNIQHIESVGYWHMAHSFVRGSWRNADESCPMILAKCCHDVDILAWLAGGNCTRVVSVGGLNHFNKEHQPAGAADRCMDGCIHRDTCPYYAPKFYLEHPKALPDGFVSTVSLDTSREAVLNALQTGPYGRCVYACDNNVVDNQLVCLEYDNGVRASLTMSAFTEHCERIINVMGSHGQIKGHMETNTLEISDFVTGNTTTIKVHTPAGGGHSGSDFSMMREFVELAASGATDSKTGAAVSVESHLATLAAEESRINGGMPIDMTEWKKAAKVKTAMKNALKPELIPTYEGSNQSTHPSVLHFEKPWNGFAYWMAMTPYPWNNDGFEDPSVLASNDGKNWVTPPGVVNPLVPAPKPGHNCDVELVYEPNEDELRLYYVEADDIKQSWVKLLRSKDGSSWTGPEVVIHDPDEMYSILSPTFQRMGDGTWQMWYVDTGSVGYYCQNNRIRTRTSPDGIHWSEESTAALQQPGHQIWHLTIWRDPETEMLHAIYPAYPNGMHCDYCKLFYARKSVDGDWITYDKPIMEPGGEGSWDDFCLYRVAFLLEKGKDKLRLWYGGKHKADAHWGIGYSEESYSKIIENLEN